MVEFLNRSLYFLGKYAWLGALINVLSIVLSYVYQVPISHWTAASAWVLIGVWSWYHRDIFDEKKEEKEDEEEEGQTEER